MNDPGVKALRDNLAVLSTFSPTNPTTAITDNIIIPGLTKVGTKLFSPLVKGVKKLWQNKPVRTVAEEILPDGTLKKQVNWHRPNHNSTTYEVVDLSDNTKYLPNEQVPLYHGSSHSFNPNEFIS